MLYCDQCGKVRGYPVNRLKVKGPCQLCNKYVGLCNQTQNDELPLNGINPQTWEADSMVVEQLQSIPTGLTGPVISEGDNYKVLGEEIILTFPKSDECGRRRIRIVNPINGERIQVTYKQERTLTNVGSVGAA